MDVIRHGDGSLEFGRFLGTGFFVGQQNMGLTAGHVLSKANFPCAALVLNLGQWRVFEIGIVRIHPHEDVAAFEVAPPSAGRSWNSIAEGADLDVRSSCPYQLWGYPEDAYFDLGPDGSAVMRPDLVYSEGHVRRGLDGVSLDPIRGKRFIELSQVAGPGCSGSPVFSKRGGSIWRLAGVYVGERVNDRSTSVGYAVPVKPIAEWRPDILRGRSVAEELSAKPV